MRAIDADALINRIVFHTDWTTDEKEAFEDEINAEPTIEERKKGKWIPHPGGKFVGFPYMHYECDQCRDFEPEERNFCPNCGCKMER